MTKPYLLSAKETIYKIRNQELTVEEVVSSFFERIDEVEERVHAFVTLNETSALQKAREVDRKVKEGKPLGRLSGVCVAVKDIICTKDLRTTCSSRMLEDFIPPYNAFVVERLQEEDAIVIGKTNMDEFGMGSSTESSYFGPTKNPWNLSYVPGGSSGGSAAAVSSGEATIALGSDTGGSVRCPASFCSLVGLKPTYGLVSRYGLIAYANSLEQIGPIARNTYDLALLLSAVSGYDQRDSTSVNMPSKDYREYLGKDVKGFKIGVPKEFFGEGVDEKIARTVWKGINSFEKLGAKWDDVSLPTLKYSLAAYYLIAMSEASSNLARYDGVRYGHASLKDSKNWVEFFSKNRGEGFGPEVRRRIILGTYALSTGYYDRYYMKSLQVRTCIRRDFEEAFKRFDILIGPTMPVPPFKIGEKISDPLALYMCDILTVPENLAGCPAITVPCGFVDELPVGMQIVSAPFREDSLLKAAYAFEESNPFKYCRPKL